MDAPHCIYGLHAVEAIIRHQPRRIRVCYVQHGREDARTQALLQLAEQQSIRIERVARTYLDQLTEHAVHQGWVAQVTDVVSQYDEADLERLLDALTMPPLLLVLDNVQDPHNLGACIRTANAAGAQAVIIPKDKSATLTAAAQKAASGAAATTPLVTVTNLARSLRALKERGIWLYGTCDRATTTLYEADVSGPAAWVLGAEGSGMRRLTRDHCDLLLRIPLHGTVSSLNVAVAAGVCLFESVRQRGA